MKTTKHNSKRTETETRETQEKGKQQFKPIKCKSCGKNVFNWYMEKPENKDDIDVYHNLECDGCSLLVECPKCGNLTFNEDKDNWAQAHHWQRMTCEKCGQGIYLDI